MAQSEIHPKNGSQKTVWSEEFERVPLKQRLKLLLAGNRIFVDSDVKSGETQKSCDLGEFDCDKNSGNNCVNSSHITAAAVTEKPGSLSSSLRGSLVVENPVEVKIECGEFNVESRLEDCMNVSKAKSEAEMKVEFLDELDHVALKERLQRLLKSECLGLSSPVLEASHNLSANGSIVQPPTIPSLANVKVEPLNLDEFRSFNVTTVGQMPRGNFFHVKTEVQTAGDAHEDYLDHMLLRERMRLLSSRDGPSLNTDQSSKPTRFLVKTEVQTAGDAHEDDLDHMLLRDRMKLLSSRDGHTDQYSKPTSKPVYSTFGCRPVRSKPAQSLKINRSRKRRKTATDSIETAMAEDAPGLLQVLIEKGVSVNEIRLYGGPECNDALDDSSLNDSFGELEEVMTKLFSQQEPILKYGPMRCSKGERASYCLACLFSLVEQARYLQFRQWPVEWGWCRDLQSFIFVFERHNRIVLERPEYGYATYFFELADALPVGWQVKRLVTAMKLASCSRMTLIENKALMVGDDLSEGEARVLMEYGWIPNTGLGTMLNYYDRVVHDRRNENDGSEWRSKIGKMLMEGYNGGTIIPEAIPIKVVEYNAAQIKVELS